MNKYDSIIIGAGHNGLVCAAYLARSGKRVLVLEAAETSGGLAASREFHPGFHASVAHSLSHFSSNVASDLKLSEYGYEATAKTLPTIGLSTDQNHVVVHGKQVVRACLDGHTHHVVAGVRNLVPSHDNVLNSGVQGHHDLHES